MSELRIKEAVAAMEKETQRRAGLYPELLDALEEMVAAYEHEGSSQNPSLLKAVSVIAKAEGSS